MNAFIRKFISFIALNINFFMLFTSSVAFALIRFLAIFENSVGYDFADSESYFDFKLFNAVRMPLITYIFSNIYYFGALTLIQVTLSSTAWLVLAFSIFKFLPKFNLFGYFLILVLGVSSPVLELDSLILSESLTLSALICSLAFFFLFLKNPNQLNAIMHLIFIFIFSQLKQSTLIVGTAWILLFIIILSIIFNKSKIKVIIFAIFLVFLNALIWNFVRENSIHDRQLSSTLIIEKTFFSKDLRNYWLAQGFPAEAYLVYGGPPFDIPIQAVRGLHSIKAWENQTESNPSFRLIKDKPLFALLSPAFPRLYIENYGYLNSVLPPLAAGTNYVVDQDFRDGRTPELPSRWLYKWNIPNTFFWSDKFILQKLSLLFLFGNLIIFSLLNKNFYLNFSFVRFGINSVILLFLGAIWINWLVTAYGYQRYLMPYSVGLRVFLIVIFILNLTAIWQAIFKVSTISQIKIWHS